MYILCIYNLFFLCQNQRKKVVQKMEKMFKEIYKNETNEHTAFVLMLGVISEKLSEIINLLEKKPISKIELTPEDYME